MNNNTEEELDVEDKLESLEKSVEILVSRDQTDCAQVLAFCVKTLKSIIESHEDELFKIRLALDDLRAPATTDGNGEYFN